MMDLTIRPVTPEIMRQRGADAFDRGQGIDDHNMNTHTSELAIADWQAGWLERQREQQEDRAWAEHEVFMAAGGPP